MLIIVLGVRVLQNSSVSEKFKHQSKLPPQAHHVPLAAGLSEPHNPPWACDVYFPGYNVGRLLRLVTFESH